MRTAEVSTDAGVFPIVDCVGSVVSNDADAAEYRHLVLAVDGRATRAEAGQFFHLLCPGVEPEAPYLRRPMSVYRADPDRGRVEFLYKVTGAGTRGLALLHAGAAMRILGPLGVGFQLDPAWKCVVAVGRGVGLATLAPVAELAATRGIGLTAILSARSKNHVISVPRFAEAGATVIVVVDSDGSSAPANVERILRRLIAEQRADAFFTCGSNRLLRLLQEVARAHGVPGQVAIEQQMACGLGMCFSCVRPFQVRGRLVSKRVCWDGPVFDLQETLEW